MRNLSVEKDYQILKRFIRSKFEEMRLSNVNVGDIALPEVFEIEPTNNCNLRCRMCHVSFMEHDQPKSLDTSLLPRLDSLKGKWVTVGAAFEPSMHPRFVELMQYLSDMECKIDLTTNGTLLTKQLTDQIADCNIKRITISFDGIKKETYEKIRRRAKYESAVERILYFREAFKEKDTYFAVNSTLMRSNIDELIETVGFWDSHDFHHIGFIFMVLRSLDDDLLQESLYPIREYAFKKLDEAAEHVINNNLKITLSSTYFNWSQLKDSHPNNVNGHLVRSNNSDARMPFNSRTHYQRGAYPGMKVDCRSPFTFAGIMWNGDVQLCDKYTVGNLNEQDFEDIWYGKKAQRVRQKVMANPDICHACDYFRLCLNSNKIDVNDKINYFQQHLIKDSQHIDFDKLVPYAQA